MPARSRNQEPKLPKTGRRRASLAEVGSLRGLRERWRRQALNAEVAAQVEVVERVRGQLEQLETRSAADEAQAARLKKGFWVGMFGQRPTKVNESFAIPRTTMAPR